MTEKFIWWVDFFKSLFVCSFGVFLGHKARKRDVSPGINNNSPNLEDKRAIPPGPKFGK